MKLKKVINIFGGPGAGKSTLAADVWVNLKKKGFNVELVTEYAKMLTYEDRTNILASDQLYIFAKQHRKLLRLKDTVDFIVTDAPLMQGIMYIRDNGVYNNALLSTFIQSTANAYPNWNVYLNRSMAYKYQTEGRNQTLSEAQSIDMDICEFLLRYAIRYDAVTASDHDLTETIVQRVLRGV